MPKKFDNCINAVNNKINKGKIKKTFRCDSKGNPNTKGKKKCKTNPYKICSKFK